jgi:hypothetical protein
MAFTAYLSSTLDDLRDEREAVKQALGDQCVVKESYTAHEGALVTSCLQDVEACDLYILIVGLRYGFVPTRGFRNPEKRSITELEYRHARAKERPCFVFLKHEDAILYAQTDAKTKQHSPGRIEAFRALVSGGDGPRPAVFSDVPQLREAVLKAFAAFKERQAGAGGRRGGAAPRARRPTREASTAAVRRAYMAWLRTECEKVVLLGLNARERQNVRLGHVYVPALVTAHEEPAERPGSRWSPADALRERQRLEPLLHRLGEESLYVPGAPGSGKSTFCRWLALSVVESEVPAHSLPAPGEFRESLPRSLRGRFPVLVELRRWSDPRWTAGGGGWTRKQLEASLAAWIEATSPGGLTPSAFADVLRRGRALLVLDGVDEIAERNGDDYPRRNFLSGLADALPAWTRAGHRVLLTSRPYGIDAAAQQQLGLARAELEGLPRPLQDVFVHRWYAASGAGDGEVKARGLIEHLDGRPDLDDLRPNPMLLTALCVKYDENMRLPGDLYRLYSEVTGQVLYKRFSTEPERDLARLRLTAVALAMHEGSARNPRATPAAEVSYDEVDDALTELSRTDRTSEQAGVEASARRERLLSDSGLLLPRDGRRAAFYHLSFQEFLAADRVRRTDRPVGELLRARMSTPGWRRTLRFLFCAVADQSSSDRALREFRPLVDHLARERLSADPNPALLLAECLEVGHARGWNLADLARPFRDACDAALECVAPPERAVLWETLGRVGLDDRPGVGVRDGAPEIDWVEIPANPFFFYFGEHKCPATLPSFRMGRYLVTNQQFQAFVDAGGYQRDEWWLPDDVRPEPRRGRWSVPTQPRETVSWFEAAAFCRWLQATLMEVGRLSAADEVRLPTEAEWERAARGTDGREYPWGATYESGRANIDKAASKNYSLRKTTPVGIYPGGGSLEGVADLAGNVWEWCGNPYGQAKLTRRSGRVRGGYWYDFHGLAPSKARVDGRYDGIGFRVVCVSANR